MKQSIRIKLTIPAKHQFLSVLGTAVSTLFEGAPYTKTQAYNMQLAVHEACANVVDHAYDDHEDGYVTLSMTLDNDDRHFTACIEDNGRPLHIENITFPPPSSWQYESNSSGFRLTVIDVPEPAIFQARGRGLFLMSRLLDEIIYFAHPNSNQWQLTKQFAPKE